MNGEAGTGRAVERARCSDGSPLSWLVLERYRLGELGPERAREVEAHLGRCEACSSCFLATSGEAAPVLRPIERRPARAEAGGLAKLFDFARRLRLPAAAAAAVAAVLLVAILHPRWGERTAVEGPPPRRVAFKGGDLAISLVRARGDEARSDPSDFEVGDRFKVLATSPRVEPPLRFEVAVYQGGEASFPLRGGALPPGNREPLPGAFTIDGREAALVCLFASPAPLPSRATLARALPSKMGSAVGVVCARLEPSRKD